MYLRELELKGFKSFAGNTQIQFEPGLNVIVGPNGCGKSNIVDAIRWVLGESNVRNLRGQRGEDVIFTGTDRKKPLGFASVSMTIDNQDHSLKTDYDELTVGRKLFRNGESEFQINRHEVRLKDIHNLFSGTGLGKRGYSIIGQGELEQILNARPFERRLILEEAASLSTYRHKKEEAEAKLQATANDILRLKDIITELQNRLSELEVKAEKARKYLMISSELGRLERTVLSREIYLYNQEGVARREEMLRLTEETGSARKDIVSRETVMNQLEGTIRQIESEISELKEKRFALAGEINNQESETKLAEERLVNIGERLCQLELDIKNYSDMITKVSNDLTLSQNNYSVKEEEVSKKAREVLTLSKEIDSLAGEIKLKEENLESIKTGLIDLLNQQALIKNGIAEKEEKIRKTQEKLERRHNELAFRRERVAGMDETLAILKKDYMQIRDDLGVLQSEKERVDQLKTQAGNKLVAEEERSVTLEKHIRQIKNQVISLEEALKSHVGYSEGIKKLISYAESNRGLIPGLIGVLADLIDVPHGLEIAIEAALGRAMENIAVNSDKDAQKAINVLKDNGWGRATFLPLNMLRPLGVSQEQLRTIKNLKGVLGLASELIGFAPEHKKAVDYLLGRTVVVETLEVGLRLFKNTNSLRIVTRDGELINPGGAITGGRYEARTVTPIRRRNDYKIKQKELEQAIIQAQVINDIVDGIKEKCRTIDDELASLLNNINEKYFRQDMLAKEIEKIDREKKQTLQEIEEMVAEERIGYIEVDRFISEIEGSREQLNRLSESGEIISENLDKEKEEYDQLLRRNELVAERLSYFEDAAKTGQRELEDYLQNVQRLQSVVNSYEKSLDECQEQKLRLEQNVVSENERRQRFRVSIVDIKRDLERVEGLLKVLEKKRTINTEQIAAEKELIIPIREHATMLEEKVRNLEIKAVRAEIEEKNARQNWEAKFGSEDWQSSFVELEIREQREMKRRTEALKEKFEDLGPVDVNVIEELEEVKNRFEFLNGQLDDLLKARESLYQLIEETETMMNSRFKDFIQTASESFKNTFTGIFSGGDASLIIENQSDSWQAGVEILVKMPGKRRQPLNLLSGGERALTCIAFIFSLLLLKPVPFCLLDEIDAALDDVNLARFGSYLKKLGQTIQFIIITHRQGTIESGETIYGVTMPEQGISEVFSLTVKEAHSLAG
ncbi:MAG: chromosome segregation protein SMC [Chitinophagales bacterium]